MAGFVDASPARFRHPAVLAFGAWNAAIWLTRIRNIAQDESLDAAGKAMWLVPAVVFGVGGVVALAAWWKGNPALARPLAAVILAVLLYWPIRTVFILFDGRSFGFRMVHVVLSVVSVGLALAAGKRLMRTNLIPRGAYR
ncbi:MAG: hypothetical protein IT196_14945 [Acidimicrobiales bacterium]|nr:hypothetical protein [Acidimicrobiales bacterium]